MFLSHSAFNLWLRRGPAIIPPVANRNGSTFVDSFLGHGCELSDFHRRFRLLSSLKHVLSGRLADDSLHFFTADGFSFRVGFFYCSSVFNWRVGLVERARAAIRVESTNAAMANGFERGSETLSLSPVLAWLLL